MWNEHDSQGKPPKAAATVGLPSKGFKITFKIQGNAIFLGDQLI